MARIAKHTILDTNDVGAITWPYLAIRLFSLRYTKKKEIVVSMDKVKIQNSDI